MNSQTVERSAQAMERFIALLSNRLPPAPNYVHSALRTQALSAGENRAPAPANDQERTAAE